MGIIGVMVVVLAILGMVTTASSRKKQHNRTLSLIRGGHAVSLADTPADKEKQSNKNRADIARKLKQAKENKKGGSEKVSISLMMKRAGLQGNTTMYWILSVVSCVMVAFILYAMGKSMFVISMGAIFGLLGLPKLFLKWKAARRQKAFLDEFADALEAMMRLLKAGMPVSEAIKMISREFTGPVSEEMSRIRDSQKLGIPLEEGVLKMSERIPLPEVQMFATGIAIQVQTGASLSEVLGNLAGVIRARHRLKRKVKSLSSEAKISAGIIGMLPILVGSALWALNPEYVELLFHHPTGKSLSMGAGIWMAIGIFVMKQMINFKV